MRLSRFLISAMTVAVLVATTAALPAGASSAKNKTIKLTAVTTKAKIKSTDGGASHAFLFTFKLRKGRKAVGAEKLRCTTNNLGLFTCGGRATIKGVGSNLAAHMSWSNNTIVGGRPSDGTGSLVGPHAVEVAAVNFKVHFDQVKKGKRFPAVIKLAAAPAAAKVPNACKIVGASHAFAHGLFGKGATFFEEMDGPSTPQNIGSDCSFRPAASKHGGIDIELYPAAGFAQLAGLCATGGLKVAHPKGLGKGAVYCVSKDHSFDDLMFTKGPYAAFLYGTVPGGQRSSLYPTKKQYLVLAHHAYAHIH